jgi:hypothetical protein
MIKYTDTLKLEIDILSIANNKGTEEYQKTTRDKIANRIKDILISFFSQTPQLILNSVFYSNKSDYNDASKIIVTNIQHLHFYIVLDVIVEIEKIFEWHDFTMKKDFSEKGIFLSWDEEYDR